jgi:hypothetical protein
MISCKYKYLYGLREGGPTGLGEKNRGLENVPAVPEFPGFREEANKIKIPTLTASPAFSPANRRTSGLRFANEI